MQKESAMPDVTCPCGVQFHAASSEVARRGRTYCSQACYHLFMRGEATRLWKGDAVSYSVLHRWVRQEKGPPTQCSFCGTTDGPLEWANISHEYHREVADWMPLCARCHRRYDRYARPTCARGHEWTAENTRIKSSGWRTCRTCQIESRRKRRAALKGQGVASAGV
jgi:hypothetical protein